MKSGDLDGLFGLTSLALDENGNGISVLPAGLFDDLTSLTSLGLNSNALTALPDGIFDNLTSLTSLLLNNNALTALPDGVFNNLTSLTTLWLHSNALTALPPGLFTGLTSLTDLRLQGNTFTTPLPANIFADFPSAAIRIDPTLIGVLPDIALTVGGIATISVANAFVYRHADGRNNTNIEYRFASNDEGVATVTGGGGGSVGSVVTITAVSSTISMGTTTIIARFTDSLSGTTQASRPINVTVSDTAVNICDRTAEVEARILAAISPTPPCTGITPAQLAAITELDISSQAIPTLLSDDFAGLFGLTTLDLESNMLTTLPANLFDPLTSLTTLDLDSNMLTTLPDNVFDNLTSLTELDLFNNDLSALPANVFSTLTSLTDLDLDVNNLSTLNAGVFDDLTSLTRLDLDDNNLSVLPDNVFDNLSNLDILFLASNQLSALPAGVFDNLTGLTQLTLDDNNLSAFPAGVFSTLTSLTRLTIGSNDLTALPAGVFVGLGSLTVLGMAGNPITTPLPADIFDPLPDSVAIEILTTPFGDIPDITLTVGGITTININNTFISSSDFSGPRTITYSSGLSGGNIANTASVGTVVTLRGTNIGTGALVISASAVFSATVRRNVPVTVTEVVSICDRTAEVQTAILAAIPSPAPACADVFASQLAAIDSLDLSGSITSLNSGDFDRLSGLTSLDLSNNARLSTLPTMPTGIFDDLTSLTTLNLFNNDLSALPADVFSTLTSLTTLDLSGNSLTALPADVFSTLTSLTSLDLSGNSSLSTLPAGLFSGLTSLVTLRLQGNTFTTPLPANLFDPLPDGALIEIDVSPIGDLADIPSLVIGGTTMTDVTNAFISRDADGNDRDLSFSTSFTGTSVASATVDEGVVTITASTTPGATDINIVADDDNGGPNADATQTFAVTVEDTTVNICDRADAVEAAILVAIPGSPDCTAVASAQLLAIASLDISNQAIPTLQSDDFAGLGGLTTLDLSSNALSGISALPADVFDPLTSLTRLELAGSSINALNPNVFSTLTSLTTLGLNGNALTALPDDLFAGLTSLATLRLQGNAFATRLPADLFDPLPGTAVIQIDVSPIGDLPSIPSLTLGGVATINIENAFISRDVDGADRDLSFTTSFTGTSVASATVDEGVVTITASDAIAGTSDVSIAANDGVNTFTRTVAVTVVDTVVNICSRTAEVEARDISGLVPLVARLYHAVTMQGNSPPLPA